MSTWHYNDVIMTTMASQITSLAIVYSIVYSDADQRKHQSSASLAFVRGIHRGPVNSPHKWPVTRKMFPFDDLFMVWGLSNLAFLNQIRLNPINQSINQSIVTAFLYGMTPLVLWIWNLTWYHKNSFICHWSQIVLCAKIYYTGSKQITNRIIRCLQICTL